MLWVYPAAAFFTQTKVLHRVHLWESVYASDMLNDPVWVSLPHFSLSQDELCRASPCLPPSFLPSPSLLSSPPFLLSSSPPLLPLSPLSSLFPFFSSYYHFFFSECVLLEDTRRPSKQSNSRILTASPVSQSPLYLAACSPSPLWAPDLWKTPFFPLLASPM